MKRGLFVYCRCIRLSGGAAGAVSRITGTLGKGIAALTLDEKHKLERRQTMGKKPVNVKEGLTRGGKGLFEVGVNDRLPTDFQQVTQSNLVQYWLYGQKSIFAVHRKVISLPFSLETGIILSILNNCFLCRRALLEV